MCRITSRMPLKIIFPYLLLVLWTGTSMAAFDVMFEKIEQINGSDTVSVKQMRVRKFNRTISVLDGIMDLKVLADDNYEITIKAAYSSKGNNQFNQYPMKIAPTKICEFVNNDYSEYYPFFEESTNFPKVGECPIEPQEFYVKNMVLNSNTFPPYLPKGLWRLSIIVQTVGGENILSWIHVYFKLEDAGVF
ncbi:uncharacterized protein LOC134205360 [Armigeres subalbatus]|uniref:uncharacterized protein LOC134205360 n=1 Tax=Armigeres subalbatus TaxID=124917 RepID=UPI002ED5FAF1